MAERLVFSVEWSMLVGLFAAVPAFLLLKNELVARLGHKYRHIIRGGYMFDDVSDARVVICIMSALMLTFVLGLGVYGLVRGP